MKGNSTSTQPRAGKKGGREGGTKVAGVCLRLMELAGRRADERADGRSVGRASVQCRQATGTGYSVGASSSLP